MISISEASAQSALLDVAYRLDYMIGQITPEEVQWQDANYDHDVANGRELLFLTAHDDWIRATSENIRIARSDTIDTEIGINIDFRRFTHEVFRNGGGHLWLPILVLPPVHQELPAPDPISTLTVTGADGVPLVILAHADVRHRVAAALTDIILKVAAALLPEISGRFSATRDHQLLLSAAIYRLLRAEHVPSAVLDGLEPARQPGPEPLSRLDRIRNELGDLLAPYIGLLTDQAPAGRADVAAARQLTERAIQVLRAFSECAVVVVAAERRPTPTALTVTVPGRVLHLAPTWWEKLIGPLTQPARRWARPDGRWWRRPLNWVLPRATLHLDLMVPSANADRQIQVELPDGVSPDPSRPLASRARLDIRTAQPLPVTQLAALTAELISLSEDRPPVLCQCLADLAAAKADAAWASLRDHRIGPGPGEPAITAQAATAATEGFRDRLDKLGKTLRDIAAHTLTPAARNRLALCWAGGTWLRQPLQRRTSMDMISPDVVAGRARMIEDIGQRAAPTEARISVHVAVTDSEYFSTARLSGLMSAALMTIVLAFFVAEHAIGKHDISSEALVLVLTLFTALQAGRIDRPDRSTIRGLLVPAGYPLIVAFILPPVVLAVALAFSHSMTWGIAWAAVSILIQLVLLLLQWLLLWTALAREHSTRDDGSLGTGRVLYTDAPDYSHLEILHSPWWRATTADALTSAHPAYGYVVWQHGAGQSTFRSLLHDARPGGERGQSRFGVHRLRRGQLGDNLARFAQAGSGQAGSGLAGAAGAADGGAGGADPAASVVRREQGADLGIPALEQPANVIALQRWGTSGQLAHFVVFRDEPKPDWYGTADGIVPVNLEPGLLTPVPDGTGIISVFLGVDPRRTTGVQHHPVTTVLRAAGQQRFIVRDVQLPVPPPEARFTGLRWARVQISLRQADLDRLVPFFSDVHQIAMAAEAQDGGPILGIQTRAEALPRILNHAYAAAAQSPASPGETHDHARLVLASDLDVVPLAAMSRRENATDRNWRLMAICATWQSGIENEILSSLDADMDLIGLTTAILHGRTVVVLLGHRSGGPARQEVQPAGMTPDAPGQPTIYLDKWLSRDDLGTAPPKPVLSVRIRTPDRPGATLDVLESLRDAFTERMPGAITMHDWNVWYARIGVPDGNLAHVQLTIILPADASHPVGKPIENWAAAELVEIERRTLTLAAQKFAAARPASQSPSAGPDAPGETVIRVELLRAPDEPDRTRQPER